MYLCVRARLFVRKGGSTFCASLGRNEIFPRCQAVALSWFYEACAAMTFMGLEKARLRTLGRWVGGHGLPGHDVKPAGNDARGDAILRGVILGQLTKLTVRRPGSSQMSTPTYRVPMPPSSWGNSQMFCLLRSDCPHIIVLKHLKGTSASQ